MKDFLDDALAVIRAAAVLSGDLKLAASWFFNDQIGLFDGLTAEALVLQGRARDVLIYIETLEAGFVGSQRPSSSGRCPPLHRAPLPHSAVQNSPGGVPLCRQSAAMPVRCKARKLTVIVDSPDSLQMEVEKTIQICFRLRSAFDPECHLRIWFTRAATFASSFDRTPRSSTNQRHTKRTSDV